MLGCSSNFSIVCWIVDICSSPNGKGIFNKIMALSLIQWMNSGRGVKQTRTERNSEVLDKFRTQQLLEEDAFLLQTKLEEREWEVINSVWEALLWGVPCRDGFCGGNTRAKSFGTKMRSGTRKKKKDAPRHSICCLFLNVPLPNEVRLISLPASNLHTNIHRPKHRCSW
mgnify:CR=1 FL=1